MCDEGEEKNCPSESSGTWDVGCERERKSLGWAGRVRGVFIVREGRESVRNVGRKRQAPLGYAEAVNGGVVNREVVNRSSSQ